MSRLAPAHDSQSLKRVVANAKLVVRSSPALDSDKLCEVERGKVVLVIDEDLVTDEDQDIVRCRIGVDTTPRGVGVQKVGWVTAMREGELKLTPVQQAIEQQQAVGAGSEHPVQTGQSSSVPWSSSLQSKLESDGSFVKDSDGSFAWRASSPVDAQSGSESMATRIAKRRQDVAKERLGRKTPPRGPQEGRTSVLGSSPPQGSDGPADGHGEQDDRRHSLRQSRESTHAEWASSVELTELARSLVARADAEVAEEQAKYGTVEARLGRLLLAKRVKAEELVKEWDRNHDVPNEELEHRTG